MAEAIFDADEVIKMVAELMEVSAALLSVGDVHLAFAIDSVVRKLTDRLFGAD